MQAATKNIVFDWNCTLLNDIDALHASTNHLLSLVDAAPVSLEFFQTHYNIPFRQLYNNLGLEPHQIDTLIAANNTHFHDVYENLARQTELRDGAVWVLQQAKAHNIGTYILSNHLVEPIRQQLQRLGIENFFADVLAYADREDQQTRSMSKGDKLRHFMEQEEIHDHPTIIVGDSVEETEIAHEQGLISVAITGGCVSEDRLRAAKPDYVIHSLHELKPIMQEHGFVS
jgi:phosphoglycolate phosphatase